MNETNPWGFHPTGFGIEPGMSYFLTKNRIMNYLKSINPYSGEMIREYREFSDEHIAAAIDRSYHAFSSFRSTSCNHRAELMLEMATRLKEDARKYGELITTEMGKPIGEAVEEVEKCAWVCKYYARHAGGFLTGRREETDASESYIRYEPLGPVLAIMPWNFPFWQVFRFTAPALMAGNTVLLKHASNTQGCAHAIEELVNESGFPGEVFINLVIGSPRVKKVIVHPAVQAVTLTGSEAAGRSVASLAGENLKKTVLELGGSNAFVVLDDADLEHAIDTAIKARLQNGGQSCIAAKRFILTPGIYESFVSMLQERLKKMLPGDPMDPETWLGPLSSEKQARDVEDQVVRSTEQGAELLMGGKRDGTFFEPTMVTGVEPGMAVFDEEVFGPVFAIARADSPEHALELSNRSVFGLGVQVFSRSDQHAALFIKEAREGSVFINDMVKSDPRLPFGGIKHSGYGRELSGEGIREFVNIKTIYKKS